MPKQASPGKPFRGRTILVVEDHEDSLRLMKYILEGHGACVVGAANGADALRVLAVEHPAVILCDLRMPVMDGCEFVTRLRQDPSVAALPVIAVTGFGEYRDLLQTWAAGFDGHLVKPIGADTLVAAVERALQAGVQRRRRNRARPRPASRSR